jgi:glutamyl-tRNA reductase
MALVCLGLSHRTAPVEVRERHAFPASRMAEVLGALRDYESVREAVMLQTCGRIEFYAEVDDYEAGAGALKSFLLNFRHGSLGYDLESYLYTLLGHEAVEHLFRVSTGLDSMLIGEAEILGQVKEAYVQAQRAGAVGTSLHRLFREALRAGKSARSTTRIGGESLSLATAAIEAVKARSAIAGRAFVIAGAGKMGRTALRGLRDEGARSITIANRTYENARALAEDSAVARAVELSDLPNALADADVLIASTGATEFILMRETVETIVRARNDRPLFIVDLAVPRDVDPEAATVPGVTLLDVDDLRPIIDERLEVRREAIPEVERIIAGYVERFVRWYRSRLAVPIIASLTKKAEAVRSSEIERLFARCPELTERERTLITGMSMTIVSKLLHSAIANIREKAGNGEAPVYARIVDELFELNLSEQISQLVPGS